MRTNPPPVFRLLLFLLLFFSPVFLASRLTAQQALLSSSSCPCTLRGAVIDSATGNPIHGAFVQVSAGSAWSVFTDAEGKFQMDGLPAGPVTVQAAKPGYLANEDLGSQVPKVFSLQITPDAAPVSLKLTPEGVIFGQVTDENGEPLEGIPLALMYRNPVNRTFYPEARQRVITDDEGKFRIAGLHPGTCYLAVHPIEGPAQTSPKNAGAPRGFAPLFYPAAPDIDSAMPIKIHPGRPSQVNFSLKREPFVRLTGTVTGYSPGQQVGLTLQDSMGGFGPQRISFDPSTGFFQSNWIPPGAYTLSAQTYAQLSVDASRELSFARQSVTANSTLSGIRLVLQPTVNIPVEIRGLPPLATGESASPRVMIILFAKGRSSAGRGHYANVAPSDASPDYQPMVVAGVEPGAYGVKAEIFPVGSYYIESVTWGSVDLLRDPLVLDSSSAVPPIDVLVREGPATLSGTVFSGDQPSSAAIFAISSDRRMPPDMGFAGPDGTFSFPNLAPGTYHIVALDNSASLDLENQDVWRSLAAKAQELKLVSKQKASLRLELTKVEE